MKTLDLINRMTDLSLQADIEFSNGLLIITDENRRAVARVSTDRRFSFNTNCVAFHKLDERRQSKLYELLNAYTMTSVEEREAVKLYRFRLQPEFAIMFEIQNEDNQGLFNYLNYLPLNDAYEFNSVTTEKSFHTVFSQKSIDNFPDHVKRLLPLCDKLDVTE